MTPVAVGSETSSLVVLSHLRWTWVWQRPQHLVSRFAAHRHAAGAHTWFVEEPVYEDVSEPRLVTLEVSDQLTRVWLELPASWDRGIHPGFDAVGSRDHGTMLRDLLADAGTASPTCCCTARWPSTSPRP